MAPLDTLYCQEEEHQVESFCSVEETPPTLLQQGLFYEDDELSFLISKESQHHHLPSKNAAHHRRGAVEWILRVVLHYSFTAFTAVLAVNYLDRFLDRFDGLCSHKKKKNKTTKPWMTQLAAVSCLSLAAKVEETHVPLLLDLQVVESKYAFEAKTIQRMELVILSTLQWRMHPVTPLSFLDYITKKLGFKNHHSWELLKRFESLLVHSLPDSRFRSYLPSVMATATMAHVINSLDSCTGIETQSKLLGILGINKEMVKGCYKQIKEICSTKSGSHFNKRKFGSVPGSPNGVMYLYFGSSDSCSVVATTTTTANPSVSSSPARSKKRHGSAA